MTSPRTAEITRNTAETKITVRINLDGTGQSRLSTGIGFFDHMLDQVARHGLVDLEVQADGDLHIDGHHTVEDIGITLGQAFAKAIGDKTGVRRFGHAYVPLDEALSRVVIDFSGRPGLVMNVPFKSGMIGTFDTQLAHEFFQGLVNHAFVTLHIDNLRGENAHHQCETVFKAFARALRAAVELDPRAAGTIPSTKGSLKASRACGQWRSSITGWATCARFRTRCGTLPTGLAWRSWSRPGRRKSVPRSAWCSRGRAPCRTACANCASRGCSSRCWRLLRPSPSSACASACR
jgi:imidazoleglycerol-phosphate dehydratase